jgi:transcriptional regulator with XRE-family HTH domain
MGFKEIGRKIQQAREEKGLTQSDLALALGLTQAALSNYELGKRRLYLHQIEKISQILGRDLEYFIGTSEGEPSSALHAGAIDREGLTVRIRELADEDLRDLSAYLDFLAWRKRHG